MAVNIVPKYKCVAAKTCARPLGIILPLAACTVIFKSSICCEIFCCLLFSAALCKRFFSPIEVALVAFPVALAELPRLFLRIGADDATAAAAAAATAKDNGAAVAAPVAVPVAVPAVEFN